MSDSWKLVARIALAFVWAFVAVILVAKIFYGSRAVPDEMALGVGLAVFFPLFVRAVYRYLRPRQYSHN